MTRGFTLVELMVVLLVTTVIAVIAFFGIKSYGNSQSVTNAQSELVSNLNSLQTQVYNGAAGLNNQYILLQNNQSSYGVYDNSNALLRTVTLPATVQLPSGWPPFLAICLANPNLTSYSNTSGISQCYQCSFGTYFACQFDGGGTYGQVGSGATTFQIGLTNGPVTKYVTIEGSGMTINRIFKSP